jgi:hypothetical protein
MGKSSGKVDRLVARPRMSWRLRCRSSEDGRLVKGKGTKTTYSQGRLCLACGSPSSSTILSASPPLKKRGEEGKFERISSTKPDTVEERLTRSWRIQVEAVIFA